jgi:hypothetical protein
VAPNEPGGLAERIRKLEQWQEQMGPMLDKLAEDQAYRARWQQERTSSRARWRRSVGWTITAIGGLVVAASAVVTLVHALL